MKIKNISILLSVIALSAVSNLAWAAGTTAGTEINNTASITYSVGGVDQAAIESSEAGNTTAGYGNGTATKFVVDKKVDLLVTAGSGVNVVPGSASTSITFVVKNEGNSSETFVLSTTGTVVGDDFDTTGCTVTSPGTSISMGEDAEQVVTVQCTIPANDGVNVADTKTSYVDLLASVASVTETVGADTTGVDTVFADDAGTATDGAGRNAKHSAVNVYTVQTADIKVTKSSEVYSDPFNGTTDPKRIPGAIIKYTITIENTGSAAASGLNVADYIPTNMTYAETPATCTADSGGTCVFDAGLVINGADAANGVSATGLSVAAGTTGTVTFYAVVD